MSLYEIKDYDYRHQLEQSIIIEYDGLIDDQMERLIINADVEIEEYIENSDWDDEDMSEIAILYEDGYKLEAIVDYLCKYNGFSRYYPPKTTSVWI